MLLRLIPAALILALTTSPLLAADYLRDQAKTTALLSGTLLKGIYLRTNSPYSLQFNSDGTLVNQRGEQGNWWVNEQGQYCRKWSSGRMQGHQACLDLAIEDDQLVIYSSDKKVAAGTLSRQ